MNLSDILQWVTTLIIGGFAAYLAFKKAPAEKKSLNGAASADYARAASIADERSSRYAAQVTELENRIENNEIKLKLLEKKSYRITIDFTIGEPPQVGIVTIEPFNST